MAGLRFTSGLCCLALACGGAAPPQAAVAGPDKYALSRAYRMAEQVCEFFSHYYRPCPMPPYRPIEDVACRPHGTGGRAACSFVVEYEEPPSHFMFCNVALEPVGGGEWRFESPAACRDLSVPTP